MEPNAMGGFWMGRDHSKEDASGIWTLEKIYLLQKGKTQRIRLAPINDQPGLVLGPMQSNDKSP